ncbi:MAG: hypothetical protein AB1772_13220, partial [Candidatus Zixiibacteriota bacterium]
MSVSGILSSNMVSSRAEAFIDGGTVLSGAGLTVQAQDDAAIDAKTTMYSKVSPTNDAGAGLLNKWAGLYLNDYQYTSNSGTKNLVFGDKVLIADDYYPADFETNGDDQLQALVPDTTIVTLSDDYAGGKGLAGSSYMFIGTPPSGSVNLGTQDYLDNSNWVEVDGTYQFMGTSTLGTGVNLGVQDYTNYGLWKRLNPSNLITDSTVYAVLDSLGTGLTGDAKSYYGLIDRNDVRSSVNAYLLDTTVDAVGDVTVQALESARIRALENSTVTSYAGAGGVIATNNVLSGAFAYIDGSIVRTDANLVVDGQNISLIEADTASTIESWDGKSAVVAFNAVGWKAQNVLFSAIDALIGDPMLSSAFDGERPAQVQAYIVDSTIDIGGALSVTAINEAQISAKVGNINISEAALDIVIPGVMDGASAIAGGGVLASNKVSSLAKAYIDFTDARGTVTANGSVTVRAEDVAGITSDSIVVQRAIASNTLAGVVNQVESVLNVLLPGDYDYTTKSGVQTLISLPSILPDQFSPQQIRIAPGYVGGGQVGANYRFIGSDLAVLDTDLNPDNGLQPLVDLYPLLPGIQVDLGTQDYSNTNLWQKLTSSNDLADLYPNIGNLTDSDAKAVGVLFVMNDVRSAVEASIDNTTLTAASVDVNALETAFIHSRADINVEASGGSFYGSGTVLAVNGQAVTNVVLSRSDAFIRDSEIDTAAGDLNVESANTSTIDATLISNTSTGDTGVGISVAFNSIGWQSQNLLMNALDTIIGRPLDDYDYEDNEIAPMLQVGDRVRDGETGIVYWFAGSETADRQYTVYNRPTELKNGDLVRLYSDINDEDGELVAAAGLYKYLGSDRTVPAGIDLNAESYGNPAVWAKQVEQQVDLGAENLQDLTRWIPVKSPFGGELPARTSAYILNSDVNVVGNLNVIATLEAQLNATVSNATSSAAAAMVDANGKAVGGVLASNKVSSSAEAYIDVKKSDYKSTDGTKPVLAGTRVLDVTTGKVYEYIGSNAVDDALGVVDDVLGLLGVGVNLGDLLDPVTLIAASRNLGTQNYATDTAHWKLVSFPAGIGEVDATGGVTIKALDNSGVYSNVKLVSSSVTTNDGGVGVAQETLNDFIPADFKTSEGSVKIEFGDKVRLADNYGAPSYTTDDGVHAVGVGTRIKVADGYDSARFTTDSGRRLVLTGDTVQISDEYDLVNTDTKSVEAAADLTPGVAGDKTVALNNGQFVRLAADYASGAGEVSIKQGDFVRAAADYAADKALAGAIYRYIGPILAEDATIDLSAQNYKGANWQLVGGEANTIYIYLGAAGNVDLKTQDYTGASWTPLTGAI